MLQAARQDVSTAGFHFDDTLACHEGIYESRGHLAYVSSLDPNQCYCDLQAGAGAGADLTVPYYELVDMKKYGGVICVVTTPVEGE
jgi:hypothetical protein